jgi:hypothetical protein
VSVFFYEVPHHQSGRTKQSHVLFARDSWLGPPQASCQSPPIAPVVRASVLLFFRAVRRAHAPQVSCWSPGHARSGVGGGGGVLLLSAGAEVVAFRPTRSSAPVGIHVHTGFWQQKLTERFPHRSVLHCCSY